MHFLRHDCERCHECKTKDKQLFHHQRLRG
jgi:hypothetical protein